uniref:Uncharacterized protein n=1 Tax=Pithovirus LCPAC302 TaxID=2506593 RepID=A0A481Z8J1_9VIRU|nr:MAG: hypothetical protein LCPAC302_00490 [Pithovirus LCPAC302]
MPLQTVFTAGLNDAGELQLNIFTLLVFSIIFGWLLVSVWLRVLENFSFETLGLDSRSTIHAIIIAVLASSFFFAFIWMIDRYDIVPASSAAASLGGASAGLLSSDVTGTNNVITNQIVNTNRLGHPIVITPLSIF